MSTRWRRTAAVSVLPLVLRLGVACGGTSTAGVDTIRVQTEVHVIQGAERQRLGRAPDQARLRIATASLEKSLGHAVAVEVDAALVPDSRADIAEECAASVESLARHFAEEARRDPMVHGFVQSKLQRIAARYRASAEKPRASFEDATGTLVYSLREPSSNGWFAGRYETASALEDAYRRELAVRFRQTDERGVKDADLEAYYRYLRTHRADPSRSETAQEHADRVGALLRFEVRARGTPIHREVEECLTNEVSWLLDRKRQGPENASLRSVYAHWIDERFFLIPSNMRSRLYRALFERAKWDNDPRAYFVELDRTRLALAFLERPVPADEKDFDAFDQALCLHEERAEKLERNRSCASVYEFLTASAAQSEQLVRTLSRTKRRDLLIAALVNAHDHTATLLAALETKGGPLYVDALRIMVNVDDYRFRDQASTLRAEVTRVWAKRPDVRPVVLPIVVRSYVNSGQDDETFVKLAREYDGLNAEFFAKFLDEGPRSIEVSVAIWPMFKNVSTPFEIVASRLDAYVAKKGLDAAKTVAGLVRRACQTRDLEGLRVIRMVLEKRVKSGDKDALALALAARDCKAATSGGTPASRL